MLNLEQASKQVSCIQMLNETRNHNSFKLLAMKLPDGTFIQFGRNLHDGNFGGYIEHLDSDQKTLRVVSLPSRIAQTLFKLYSTGKRTNADLLKLAIHEGFYNVSDYPLK